MAFGSATRVATLTAGPSAPSAIGARAMGPPPGTGEVLVLATTDTGEPNVKESGAPRCGSWSNGSPESVTRIVKWVVVRLPGVNVSVGSNWTARTAAVAWV